MTHNADNLERARVAQLAERRGCRKDEGTPSQAVSEVAGSRPAPGNPIRVEKAALPDPAEAIGRLFPRRRARLVVEVDLDPVPGWGNWADDWRAMLQSHLDGIAPSYHPTVSIERADR